MKVTDLKLLFEKITFDDFNVTDDSISYKNSLVYGEVSINDIGNIISSQKINFDSMIDVGSGCGKLTIYIALVCNINSEGIEIDKSRFMKSEKLLEFYDLYDKVNFMNGSFEQLYFGNYDLLYCCNLVFDHDDNNILFNKIKNEFNGIVILFIYDKILLPYLTSQHIVKTSWSNEVPIFLFQL
jgi:ubiquinone/menaquinone biosynthesis C-methylase UbiE|tara:strand:- start:169 stop:717 length:549 start_codon:yes stop_codon:yes gene_type:complete